jgi:anti-sigma regulatory factor (Ser/Thr protein kinase)/CheY-like chemotaxis protein
MQAMTVATRAQDEPLRRKAAVAVDADGQVIGVLRSVLKWGEWDIVYVPDNATVLKIGQNKPLDLIITGARTSGSEDVDLLHKIRRVQPHIRLIILTDESTPADVIASMREGAFSYFSRPFSNEALIEMVRMAVAEPAWDDGIEVISATPEWISVIVRCDTETADRLVHFSQEISDLPDPEKGNVAMAFHELLLNAMEHGGKFDPEQYVEISYVRTRKMIMCRIKDPGKGFLIEEIKHAAINNPSYDPIRHALFREKQGLRPGGYGVLIAKHLVDELVYGEKGNEVLLVKYLHSD